MRKLRHKDRKQLAQDHMGFETQMCLTPDPGVGMESWFFFAVTQTLLQDAPERSIRILTQMTLLFS